MVVAETTWYAVPLTYGGWADRKVLACAPIGEVERYDHPWVQEYFHGPRARAAQVARMRNSKET